MHRNRRRLGGRPERANREVYQVGDFRTQPCWVGDRMGKKVRPWRCGVNFSEQPPSKQWAALNYKGVKIAEVWFKPKGEPFVVTFRIPKESFQIPGMREQLTLENLLKAVAIVPEEVESWRHEDVSHSGMHGSNPLFRNTLPPPPQHVTHLEFYVCLKPPPAPVRHKQTRALDIPSAKRHNLE